MSELGSGDTIDAEGTAERLPVRRVLIVEAEMEEAQFLREALEDGTASGEVEVTFTGERALELLDDRGFDCVIQAFELPETNGVSLVRDLRERGHDLPVVVRSDRSPELLEETVIEAGADAFLREEAEAEEVRRTIEEILPPEATPTAR